MAQKTPLPALTVNYADRWNDTWFADTFAYRHKIVEGYHLRFLIMRYLRVKRMWLYLYNVNTTGGFSFFHISPLHSVSKPKLKPFVYPNKKGKLVAKDWQKTLDKTPIPLTIFQNLPTDIWKKRLSWKKTLLWRRLWKRSCFDIGNSLFYYHRITTITKPKTLGQYFRKHQKKLVLSVLTSHLVPFTEEFNQLNSMSFGFVAAMQHKALTNNKVNNQLLEHLNFIMILPSFLKFLLTNTLKRVFFPTAWLLEFRLPTFGAPKEQQPTLSLNPSLYEYNKVTGVPTSLLNRVNTGLNKSFLKLPVKLQKKNKRWVSNFPHTAKMLLFRKTFNLKKKLSPKFLSIYFKKTLPKTHFLKRRALYQTVSHLRSFIYRRAYAFKKFPSLAAGFKVFFKRFGGQYKYKRAIKLILTPLVFLVRAMKKVTGMRIFLSYLPIAWDGTHYRAMGKHLVFEKYGHKKYFAATFVAVHLAMSRGSAILLCDLLVRKLRFSYQHSQFLSCVETICRYFMAPPDSNTAYPHSICKGIEILFTGKVNGNDRSSAWRFKLGPVHTSTFYTNTREEHAKCMTKFGMFNIRVRLKLGLKV